MKGHSVYEKKRKRTDVCACQKGEKTLKKGNEGAVAQLGERYNGIVEVGGSIPLGSTIFLYINYVLGLDMFFLLRAMSDVYFAF